MARHVNAYSGRGGRTNSDPVLHASPNPPVPYSRTGATYVAACGAQVRNVTRVGWDPGGVGRRCRACVRAVPRAGAGLVERTEAFTDPIAGDTVTLVVAGTEPSLWDGTVGVRHPGCEKLADVSADLDAFYCQACRRNGRVSGAWVVDVMAGRA